MPERLAGCCPHVRLSDKPHRFSQINRFVRDSLSSILRIFSEIPRHVLIGVGS